MWIRLGIQSRLLIRFNGLEYVLFFGVLDLGGLEVYFLYVMDRWNDGGWEDWILG